ncbi:MAG: OmpA family protein [Thiotrichales bacterium]|nr:MAG: OmpA family protein [Thiotrichales bacterium]
MKLNRLIFIGAVLLPSVYADTEFNDTPEGKTTLPAWQLNSHPLGNNTERQLPPDEVFTLWVQDETMFKPREDDRIEMQKVLDKQYETFKLKNAVPDIGFESGEADIPQSAITKLREVLNTMKHRANVRVHFVGHSDSDQLSPALSARYVDNIGLSRARAEIAAEFFQRALDLPPESVTYDGVGDTQPIATNNNDAGKRKNRRVEVQVWYDEVTETAVDKEVVIKADNLNRIKVCRQETVCKLRYRSGNAKRARLKNLVEPLRLKVGESELPGEFMRQIREVLGNLRDKNNVVVHFVGHTDNLPLTDGAARIYRDHLGLSKARARRVALGVQEILRLPNNAISSAGKGASYPVASNDTDQGRALNQRVEVEFWHDDPFQQFTADAQSCPESETAEIITMTYDPPSGPIRAIHFQDGQPVIPPGYSQRLKKIMDEIADRSNVRLGFTGYTNNERMDRRAAMVYGDDIGLSTSRARRAMEMVQQELGLDHSQVEYEGLGFVHSKDVASTGFVQFDGSRVEVAVLYDQLAVLEEDEGLEVTRIDQEAEAHNPYALNLMRITIDGEPEFDPYKNVADLQRCTDVALENADIQFRFDNLELSPRLNVTAWPNRVRYRDDPATALAENTISFRVFTNYPSFIERAEVRVFEDGQSINDEPLAVVDVENNIATWEVEFETFTAPVINLKYLLRVYDSDGNYDETRPLPIWLVDGLSEEDLDAFTETTTRVEQLVGYGENHLDVKNIPLSGGTVLVNGNGIPDGHSVWLAGRQVPVSEDGTFVAEEIFDRGYHTVEVAVLDNAGNGELYLREMQFKKNDWFYVGIADFTMATDSTNGPAELVTGDNSQYDNDLDLDGRLAYYTNGKFGDNWQLVSSADTREGSVDELFSNFIEKDPKALFRRIDPDRAYPTFGDDSTVWENAPTSGKFYVKLRKNESFGMWGNFIIGYTDTDLAHIDRGLYGANGYYVSSDTTSAGEKKVMVGGFAAEPGTISGRDEFRGTGGSLYFLRHQDILIGSERLRIEVRDKDSLVVIGAKNLVPAIDYDIDYIQGRILLSEPLESTATDDLLVREASISGNPVYLVTRYEYVPGFNEIDDVAMGGRAHYWFNDNIKLGITASQQDEADTENSLNGVDLTLRKNAGTWLKAEYASSEGDGGTALNSSDGGFTFDPLDPGQPVDDSADAYRVEAATRLEEVFSGTLGSASVYVQQREAGFSAPGQLSSTDISQYGGKLNMRLTERSNLNVKADAREQKDSLNVAAVEADADYVLTQNWRLGAGGRFDSREDNSADVPVTQVEGDRLDLTLEATYDSQGPWLAYGYGQVTANRTGNREENNRVGAGGQIRATKKLNLDGELSYGSTGPGARLGTDYLISDRSSVYWNYSLVNERTDNGIRSSSGNMNTGFRTRYSDTTSLYGEQRYTHGDVPTALTHALGIDLAPTERWSYGASLEVGTLRDDATGAETDRKAVGLTMAYNRPSTLGTAAVEYRTDDTEDNTGAFNNRVTWLFKSNIQHQLDPSWRLLGKLNFSDSESSQGEFFDGKFTEAVLGYGYRPVTNDRWNSLFKYTYFYNMPTAEQVTTTNTAVEFIQKSHILSLDAIYDLTRRWSLGGKYAYRLGQVSQDRVDVEFFDSTASLYVLRADWHFIHHWDALVEARLLDLPDAQDRRAGTLWALYRHVGKNLKFGVGYNFTDFSDDLTDLNYDSQGFFINLVGKI